MKDLKFASKTHIYAFSSVSRALASDSDNGMHQLVLAIMRRLGVMEETEEFDADTVKSKLIFVTAQLVYTLATLAPVPLLYSSFSLSNLYLALLLGWTVFRFILPRLCGKIQIGREEVGVIFIVYAQKYSIYLMLCVSM